MPIDRSRNGESSIVLKLVGNDCPCILIDVGASDGHSWSNSSMLVEDGWWALMIEPVSFAFKLLKSYHGTKVKAHLLQAACSDFDGEAKIYVSDDPIKMGSSLSPKCDIPGVGFEGEETVPVFKLDTLIERYLIPADFGLLSVDAEQHDLEVIRGISLDRNRPRVIIVENNSSAPAIDAHLKSHRYEHFALLAEENHIYLNSLKPELMQRAKNLPAYSSAWQF